MSRFDQMTADAFSDIVGFGLSLRGRGIGLDLGLEGHGQGQGLGLGLGHGLGGCGVVNITGFITPLLPYNDLRAYLAKYDEKEY